MHGLYGILLKSLSKRNTTRVYGAVHYGVDRTSICKAAIPDYRVYAHALCRACPLPFIIDNFRIITRSSFFSSLNIDTYNYTLIIYM